MWLGYEMLQIYEYDTFKDLGKPPHTTSGIK